MRLFQLLAAIVLAAPLCGCRSAGHYVERGDRFFEEGAYSEASLQYRNAIRKDPASGEAYYRLALSEIEQRNVREAFQAMRQAVELAPEIADAKVRLAEMALAIYLGDPASGQTAYDLVSKMADELVEADPGSYDGLTLHGRLALADNRPAAAIEFFKQALEGAPGRGEIYPAYLQALIDAGRAAEAEQLAGQALEAHPGIAAIYDVLYRHYSAGGRQGRALEVLERKIANNPDVLQYRIQVAEHWARLEDAPAMKAALDEILARSDAFPDARLEIGDFHVRRRAWDDAVEAYRSGAAAGTERQNEYLLRIARVRQGQGRFDDAFEEVEKVLAKDPDERAARLLRADLLLQRGGEENLRAAVEEYERLRRDEASDAETDWKLGTAHLGLGDRVAARRAFEAAARKRPGYLEPRLVLAVLALEERRPADALSFANSALQFSPDQPQALLLKASAELELGQLDQARANLTSLARRYPDWAGLRFQQALLALREDRFADAERILGSLNTEQQNDPRAVQALSEVYLRTQQNERALSMVQEKLSASPDSPRLRRLLADTALRAGEIDLATEEYRRLVDASPDSPALAARLGDAYRLQGNLEAAAAQLQRAVALAPKNPAALLVLASTLEQSDQPEEAIASYRKALRLQPDNGLIMNNLAFLLAEQGALDEALRLAESAASKLPDQPAVKDTLAWVYFKKGMNESALQIFSSLVREHPGVAPFHYHRGVVLHAAGRTGEARSELQAAADAGLAGADKAEADRLLRELR